MLVRLTGHWDLHWRVWVGFMTFAEHCKKVKAAAILEWPRNCEYWDEPVVAKCLNRLGFEFAEFDGCMYGLTTRFTGVVTLPVRHP